MVKLNPTELVSDALSTAYSHFNVTLFNNRLPGAIIHMHRKAKCYGYFAGGRFGASDGTNITDEIALNPSHFKERTIEQSLSTLVHEMVHLWQHHYGEKKSKTGYHNKEWADHMKDKGLFPSSTGAPGGKETGQKVSHYIMPDGFYAESCAELLASGFTLPYIELWTTDKKTAAKKAASKTKYTCPDCGMNAWAKANVSLSCNDCSSLLESE